MIKGTQIYNAEAGGFVDVSLLDVTQIFGRAGRPQFDTSGHGIIITSHDKLPHYTSMLTHQKPIGRCSARALFGVCMRGSAQRPLTLAAPHAPSAESSFIKALPDHLNAEIVSGTVTNVHEGAIWLSYTYLFIRMLRNSLAYGINARDRAEDPMLEQL